VLRSYLRQRSMLVTYASHHVQHMQKALTQMNLKLQHVVSAGTSVTGMAIIRVSSTGERDPSVLAQLRDRHCQHREAEIARALQGHWRTEPLFALQPAVELYEFYHCQTAACDRQIEGQRQTLTDQSGGASLFLPPRANPNGGATNPTVTSALRGVALRASISRRLRGLTSTPPWGCSGRLART
jgi:hypothetical protein